MFIVAVLGILALVLASLVFVLVSIVTITSIKGKLNNSQPDKRAVQTTSSSVPRARTQPVTRRSPAPPLRYGSRRNEEGDDVTLGSYGSREHVQPLGRNEEESSDLLPSGYRRGEYHHHRAVDDDVHPFYDSPFDDSREDEALLPSGYRRSEYHHHGATDDDIEFWGLDRPGAPPPEAAGSAVWDLLDQMDADGDGFIDDPFDDPFC